VRSCLKKAASFIIYFQVPWKVEILIKCHREDVDSITDLGRED
jgi:hypothetical protein